MAVDLTKPAQDVDLLSDAYKPLMERLQANILKSHGRDESRHVFLRFTGPAASVRAWIRDKIAPRVLSARLQHEQARDKVDGGLVVLFYLSAEGYRYLGLDADKLKSRVFRKGMKHQGSNLIKELFDTDNKDPKPEKWEPGFQKTVHAMVALGDDQKQDQTRLLNEVSLLKAQVAGFAEVLLIDAGRALRRIARDGTPLASPEPIEHFGYFDGISQPLFGKDDLQRYYDEGKGTKGDGNWDPGASLDLVLEKDPFAADADAFGSYLVYRKLHQNYGEFQAREEECGDKVGLDGELAGAMAVGRFEDGTPVAVFEQEGNQYTNDFVFKSPVPGKSVDPNGFKCPAHAHIRKVNPRGTTPSTSLEDERRRRIVRRGIPYGKPFPGLCGPDVPSDPDPAADRGLLFMCFQANVEKQFEFIQRTWVDNPNFPTNVFNLPTGKDTGDDPLIGQNRNEPQRWPKTWGDEAAGRERFNFESAVTLKGGEYLFAPSLPVLKSL
jgi:Dyp-type peroxidase family